MPMRHSRSRLLFLLSMLPWAGLMLILCMSLVVGYLVACLVGVGWSVLITLVCFGLALWGWLSYVWRLCVTGDHEDLAG